MTVADDGEGTVDLFELIRKHYGRRSLSASITEPEGPPLELPSISAALEMCIDEIVKLRGDIKKHENFFTKEVVTVINGGRELDRLKATHFAGIMENPYHNSRCTQNWGYVSNCPTCRVIKYAEDTRNELTKEQKAHAETARRLAIAESKSNKS